MRGKKQPKVKLEVGASLTSQKADTIIAKIIKINA